MTHTQKTHCPLCKGLGYRPKVKSKMTCPACYGRAIVNRSEAKWIEETIRGANLAKINRIANIAKLTLHECLGYLSMKYAIGVLNSTEFDTSDGSIMSNAQDPKWIKAGLTANKDLKSIIKALQKDH